MKRLSALALTICILIVTGTNTCLSESKKSIADEAQLKLRGATYVEWAGCDYVLVNEKVIQLSTGKTILEDIQKISSWNNVSLAFSTTGAWYQIDENGGIRKFNPIITEKTEYAVSVASDYIFSVDSYHYEEGAKSFVYDLKKEKIIIEEEFINYRPEFFLFEGNGEKRIVSTSGNIYNEDGRAIIDHAYTRLCGNANGDYVTNGFLTGYNADTKESIVISLPSGSIVCTFPGRWAVYEGNYHQIFTDNTALIESNTDTDHFIFDLLVSLDGSIILQLDHGNHFGDRSSHELYEYELDGEYYRYDVLSNESWKVLSYRSSYHYWNDDYIYLYQSLKSGKITVKPVSNSDFDPEWIEKHPPISPQYGVYSFNTADETYEEVIHKYGLVNPDGELLGNRLWDSLSLSYIVDIEEDHVWGGKDTMIVYDQETGCGVIDREGNLVLPPIFDTQDGKNCINYCGEYGFAARKDGEWHFYSKDGQMQY